MHGEGFNIQETTVAFFTRFFMKSKHIKLDKIKVIEKIIFFSKELP